MFNEFRTFIMRGNVVDLAVGVIVGASFGKIVSSLVDDIIMPPLGLITRQEVLLEEIRDLLKKR